MINSVNWAIALVVALLAMIACVYLWSDDPARRERALHLLQLLLRSRQGRGVAASHLHETRPERRDTGKRAEGP